MTYNKLSTKNYIILKFYKVGIIVITQFWKFIGILHDTQLSKTSLKFMIQHLITFEILRVDIGQQPYKGTP